MAEQNLIKKTDLARVREVDFVERFKDSVVKLVEMLGITRKVPKTAGAVLKSYRATGTLQDGIVPEGDVIPLSKYETEEVPWGEITLKKWRKSTSAEAIVERGYDQAVGMTTDKMLKDVQKGVRGTFVDFLATGEGEAEGADLQDVLAHAWGKLNVLFEDDDAQAVYFVNTMDVADYLGAATVTLQTAFGLSYIKDFLGLGTVIVTGLIPQGKVYATVADNIILYYIPVNGADLDEAFNFTADETGYIGIHESPDYNNMTAADTVVSGIALMAERIDGIVVGTIGNGNDEPDPDNP